MGCNANNLIMIPIENLELTARAYSCLRRGRIKTIGELLEKEDEELMKIRGLGNSTLEEIKEIKRKLGHEEIEVRKEVLKEEIREIEIELKVINKVFDTNSEVNMEEVKFYDRVIVDDIDIQNLGLSIRTNKCLLKSEIYKVSELVNYNYKDLLKIRNFGKASEEELINKLKSVCISEKEMDRKEFIKANIFKYLESNDKFTDISEVLEILPEGFKDESVINGMVESNVLDKDGDKVRVHITTILEFVDKTKNKRNAEIIKRRLDGLTLDEVGIEFNLTRERVRQIYEGQLSRRRRLREDDFKKYFTTYNLTSEQFTKAFGVESYVYNYLDSVYEKGTKTFEEFIAEKEIEEEIRFKGAKTGYFIFDKEYVKCDRKSLEKYIIKTYFKEEHNSDDFLIYYNNILKENNLENDNRFKLSERYTTSTLLMRENLLHKPRNVIRYYDFDKYDISKLLIKLKLHQYKNVEISTLKIFQENEELMKEYDIRDEYELHNILKKSTKEMINVDMKLKRMPIVQFGNASREKQIKDILKGNKNIGLSEFIREYEKLYGFKNILSSSESIEEFYGFRKNGVALNC